MFTAALAAPRIGATSLATAITMSQSTLSARLARAAFGDPLPYDAEAARMFGQLCAVVYAQGRQPRSRTADLMIAATAASNELPLFTANPKDFDGLERLVDVVAVMRPHGATGQP
ncbi:VapC toxin family PIN domain ribonuclease [Nonomuraea sp. NPDC050691]|uniref:VapC toxin family PIN domain ribonuclease n=1 Tax=Nonomuraea sp. NPDC050691 TaxID=3155661 RepID=UPI0033C6FF71